MQADLDGKSLITYRTIDANAYNTEDMMSIPTSINRGAKVISMVERAELAIAA
jgi:hypothetical protein